MSKLPKMILFCLDNLNGDRFLVGFGFDLDAFFAIKTLFWC
ncbi:hypothetical protein I600_3573 [Maribacter dokdonensis DSW-8]|nr:hypothetical protein I600_3573 [Maribacter dokdonensis DSW-8]